VVASVNRREAPTAPPASVAGGLGGVDASATLSPGGPPDGRPCG